MTFIISVATRDFALQVADTLLTVNGRFSDDELVKTTIVQCRDAKVAISYTGVAFIDRKRTDKWLVARLRESQAAGKVFMQVLELLKDALTEAIRRNPELSRYGLTLAIVGLGYSFQGVRQPAIALVTNCAEPQSQRNEFKDIHPRGRQFSRYVFSVDDNFTDFISIHGAIGPKLMINGLRRKIQKQVRKARTHSELNSLISGVIMMLRRQRRDTGVGHLIGDDCTAVLIKTNFSSVSWFNTRTKKIKRFPNIVCKDYTVEDLQGRNKT